MKAWSLANASNSPCAKYINVLLQSDDPATSEVNKIKDRIRVSTRTKASTYFQEMNPELEVHNVYTSPGIPEHHRIAFTQLQLSSHNLAIETGRWARVPRESRLCTCGSIQSESHVLSSCEQTEDIRQNASSIHCFNLADFFNSQDTLRMCLVCYDCLHVY